MVGIQTGWRLSIGVLAAVAFTGAVLWSAPKAHADGGTVIEARGEASYTVPIVVPPGPAGHQPSLALAYNSGEGKGAAGWLGFGWTLSGESRIERDTRTGTPYDFDNVTCGPNGATPCYRETFVLDGQDLICTGTSCSPCPVGSPSDTCRYRTQSDDGRLIYYFGETNGWRIYDRDGRTLVYGSSAATQLSNPDINHVFSWQLESSTDVSGNVISYQYDTTSTANVVYLKKILYGAGTSADRTVEFVLETRPDNPLSMRSGFRQQIDRRVASVIVSASGALVTRYELAYSPDPDSTRSNLVSVQRKGSDGVASLPPYQFEYSARDATVGLSPTASPDFPAASGLYCDPSGGFTRDLNASGVIRQILDMNRDGVTDWIDADPSYRTGPTDVYLGTGKGWVRGLGQSTCADPGHPGIPWYGSQLWIMQDWGYGGVLDIDGDGFPDSFELGIYQAPYGIRVGSGSGFLDPPRPTSFDLGSRLFQAHDYDVYALPYELRQHSDTESWVDEQLIDMNGDGRPDLVATYTWGGGYLLGTYSYDGTSRYSSPWDTYTGWAVFLNRGWKTGSNGTYLDFGSEPFQWPAAPDMAIAHSYEGTSSNIVADENGDGLPDLVRAQDVAFGTGSGFIAAESQPTFEWQGLTLYVLYDAGLTTACTYRAFVDLNGDGFLDYVDTGDTPDQTWTVHFGNGYTVNSTAVNFPVQNNLGGTACLESDGEHTNTTSLHDFNGDGVPDFDMSGSIFLNFGARSAAALADPNLPSAPLPGLLLRATDPLGGTVEFTYQAVPQMKDEGGLQANPGFGLTRPVVSRVKYRDGRDGTPPITTTYHYANGVFDYSEKEFRGFGTVTATLEESGQTPTTVVTTRNTDRTCAFTVASQETSSGSSVIRRESTNYVTVTGGAGVPSQWGACLPSEHIVEAVEGNEATKKVSRTTWDYGSPIDPYYRVQTKTDWGAWDLAAAADIPGDERVTTYSYAIPSSSVPWSAIVARLKLEQTEDLAGTVYAKRQYCYTPTCTVAASKGVVVKIKDYLTDPTLNPPVSDSPRTVASILYDSYGNATQNTGPVTPDDADGLQTQIAYDPTYHTFPISVSKGSDTPTPLTTTIEYTSCPAGSPPPALGLPCSVTEPGNQTTSFQYDAFGRVTRVERPASGYAETRSYTLPPASGVAGETILETRQLQSGVPDLVYETFMDGLGRTFREESAGKASETVAVDRTFDDRGRMASETLPYLSGTGLVRTFAYDAVGRLARVVDPDGTTTRALTYTPWTVVDETYFGAVSPGNRQERKESTTDGLGRLVRVANYEDAVGAATPYVVTATYDPADRLLQVLDPIANDPSLCNGLNGSSQCQSQTHVTSLVWDTLGRRVRIDDPDSGTWVFRYDDAGLLKERTQTSNGSTRTQLFAYDPLQRLATKNYSPAGNGVADAYYVYSDVSSSSAYGKLLLITASGGTSYNYGYDAAGRVSSIFQATAGKAFSSSWTYDALDRMKTHTFPDGELFSYAYDGARLSTITGDAGNAVFTGTVLKSAQFDALGRIDALEIGQGSGGAPVASVDYQYDASNARLTRVLGTPGNFATNDPDGDGVTSGDHCPYAYDPNSPDTGGVGGSSPADGIGNACQCGDVTGDGQVTSDDASAILAFGFNGTPLAKPELCDVNGDGGCDLSDYNAVSAAVSSPPGDLQHCLPSQPANRPSSAPVDLTVAFDGLGRLTSQTGTLGADPVSRSYTYDGLSRLKTATGPWEKPFGITSAVTWTYTYDALGNLRTQTTTSGPYSGDSRTWNYADPVRPHFLTQFIQNNQYDEDVTATEFGEPGTIARTSPQTQDPLLWNAQGKLYQAKSSTYSYDAFDQNTLVATGTGSAATSIVRVGDDFEYDVSAARATKYFSVDGIRIAVLATSYTAGNASVPPVVQRIVRRVSPLAPPFAAALLALGLASLAAVTTRKRAPAWASAPGVGLLAIVLVAMPVEALAATLPSGGPGTFGRPAEPFLAYITDHLGSVRAVVNQNGIVVETRDYDPFGADIAHVGAFSTQHRFTGQPQDDQGRGLYNYGARFYNPKWGRFVSPDEMTQGFDSQGLNPFAYVLNRPTSAIDPSGNDFDFGSFSFGSFSAGSWGGFSFGASTGGGVGGGPGTIYESNPGFGWWYDPNATWWEWALWVTIPGSKFIEMGIKRLTQPSDYNSRGGGGGGDHSGSPGNPPLDTPSTTQSLGLDAIRAGQQVRGLYEYHDDFDLFGENGTHYGHWWKEAQPEGRAWGWWPNRATSSNKEAFLGVPGELNQGWKNDPHMGVYHDTTKYDVYARHDFTSRKDVLDAIDKFATSYSGPWRITGPNCHTFQQDMNEAVGLEVRPSGEK